MTGRNKYYRKHPEMRKTEREKREKRKCKNCGKVFRFKNKNQIYCCKKCQAKYSDRYLGSKNRDYWKRFSSQKGVCAICGKEETKKRLATDHDHKTGEIRGLLCSRCNLVLGLVNDDVEILREMIKYLE